MSIEGTDVTLRATWRIGEQLDDGRFEASAAALSGVAQFLQHPPGSAFDSAPFELGTKVRNLLPVLDHGLTADALVVITPRTERTLADELAAPLLLDLDTVGEICTDICDALEDLGSSYAHGDLSPNSIVRFGERWCIADVGLTLHQRAGDPATGVSAAAAPYAAPERWRLQPPTAASDIYAFGALLFHLITGRPPFDGPTVEDHQAQHLSEPVRISPAVTSRIAALLEECLLKAPQARPTAQQLRARMQLATASRSAGLTALNRAGRELARDEPPAQLAAEGKTIPRQALAEDACASLGAVFGALELHLLDAAPTARRTAMGAHRGVALGHAHLTLHEPVALPTLAWGGSDSPGFDVIAAASVRLVEESPTGDTYSRSHSLWFGDPFVEGQFLWFEAAFAEPYRLAGQLLDVPFALGPGAEAASSLFGGLPAQLVWPLSPLDEDEFISRWAGWLALAATNRLQPPTSLPERPVPQNWRTRPEVDVPRDGPPSPRAGGGILAEARRWLGTTEYAYNVVPGITDRLGINGQSWCAAAVTVWAEDGGSPLPADLPRTFYVPHWVRYACEHGQAVDIRSGQPGDIILLEWPWTYPWRIEAGRPIIRNSGTGYDGTIAGSHVGVVAAPFDGSGYATIEGNTSAAGTNGSQDNGDGVWARYRPIDQVCCIWRPASEAPATTFGTGTTHYRLAPSGMVWGVDVSEYQTAVDWDELRAAGVSMVAIRVGDGSHRDPRAAQHYRGARRAGLLVEPYFFARDDEDPVRQTARWIGRADEIGPWDMPLCVDYEHFSMRSSGRPRADWIESATSAVAARWPGQAVPLYIGWYILRDLGFVQSIADRCVIWIPGGERYDMESQLAEHAPVAPHSGPSPWECHAQQWTQRGWVNHVGAIDLNVITPHALKRLLGDRDEPLIATEEDVVRAYQTSDETIFMVNSTGQFWKPQPPPGYTGKWDEWEAALKEAVAMGHVALHHDGSLFKPTTHAALAQLKNLDA